MTQNGASASPMKLQQKEMEEVPGKMHNNHTDQRSTVTTDYQLPWYICTAKLFWWQLTLPWAKRPAEPAKDLTKNNAATARGRIARVHFAYREKNKNLCTNVHIDMSGQENMDWLHILTHLEPQSKPAASAHMGWTIKRRTWIFLFTKAHFQVPCPFCRGV